MKYVFNFLSQQGFVNLISTIQTPHDTMDIYHLSTVVGEMGNFIHTKSTQLNTLSTYGSQFNGDHGPVHNINTTSPATITRGNVQVKLKGLWGHHMYMYKYIYMHIVQWWNISKEKRISISEVSMQMRSLPSKSRRPSYNAEFKASCWLWFSTEELQYQLISIRFTSE